MKSIHKYFTGSLLLMTIFFSSCKKDLEADYVDKGYVEFMGDGSFDQMIPAPTTASTGIANFYGRFDNNLKIFNYTLKWVGVSSTVTKADFYFPSSSVQTGFLVRNSFTSTKLATDSTSGAFWTINSLSSDDVANLKAGNVYYIISTSLNTTGEIRGKIILK